MQVGRWQTRLLWRTCVEYLEQKLGIGIADSNSTLVHVFSIVGDGSGREAVEKIPAHSSIANHTKHDSAAWVLPTKHFFEHRPPKAFPD